MADDLIRDAIIHLTSRQWDGGKELEPFRLTTQGKLSYAPAEKVWSVSYDESEATGLGGTHTRLSLFPDGRVRLVRTGQVEQNLEFVKGEQRIEQSETPYGRMKFSVLTHDAGGTLTETGGDLRLGYALTLNDRHMYSTRLSLCVMPDLSSDSGVISVLPEAEDALYS